MTTEIKNKINAQEAQSIITHRGPSLVALMYVHLKLHISSKMGLGSPCTFSFIIQKTVKVNLLMEIGVIIFGSVWFGFFRAKTGSNRFGSVFPVWLGFLSVSVRFGSVFRFFFSVRFFRLFFFRFSRFNRFSGFFAHP
jgi:hypothetical protein